MTKQSILLGSVANDGTGDSLRAALTKTNQNFDELYGILNGDRTGVTVSNSGLTWTVNTNTLNLDRLTQLSASTILGRTSGSTGNVEALTVAQATSLLNSFSSSLKGLVPASGGGTNKFLRADGTWTAVFPTPLPLVDAATVTPNFATDSDFEWTIAGNRTLANPTGAQPGQFGLIKIQQDATGSRIISYGSNWWFPGGGAGGVLSTTANSIDLIKYNVRSDGVILAVMTRAFA